MLIKRILKTTLIVATLFFLAEIYGGFSYKEVKINENYLKAELVSGTRALRRGLSKKEKLPEGEGMILMFRQEDYHGIWMKDMQFSIDIIWLNKEKEVVDYKTNVSPESYPKKFYPIKPAKYVLEVNAGFIEEKEIQIGDILPF